MELWIRKANCKVTHGFSTVQRAGIPNPHVDQGLTVLYFSH